MNYTDLKNLLAEAITLAEGGDPALSFDNVKTIFEANPHSLVWINPTRKDKVKLVEQTQALTIICDSQSYQEVKHIAKNYLITENPKWSFTQIIEAFFLKQPFFGIHEKACIEPGAIIGKNVSIGAFTYVSSNCTIGDGSILYGHCYLYEGVKIGKNVLIHAGTVIGTDGFGYSKDSEGRLHKFPHIGGVLIEDDVEIGANTCIDRGSLGDTVIKKGARIDNLVHIAHNVIIEENAAVIAHAMIGGSTVIGKNAWIAPAAIIRDVVTIGNNATVGLGSVVTKDIPEQEVWLGNPAKRIDIFKKIADYLNRLVGG